MGIVLAGSERHSYKVSKAEFDSLDAYRCAAKICPGRIVVTRNVTDSVTIRD